MTYSADFPVTAGAFQKTNRSFGKVDLYPTNAFLTVLDPNARPSKQLVYSTYLGGSGGADQGFGLAVDPAGVAYVGGTANSTDFPVTQNAFQKTQRGFSAQATNSGYNSFISIVDPSQSGAHSLKYSTYLGGSFGTRVPYDGDFVQALALDAKGRVYLTGSVTSENFPVTPTAFQREVGIVAGNPSAPTLDSFLTVLDPAKAGSSQLVYSTYLGGTNEDFGHAIAVDSKGFAYVAGYTCLREKQTDDFPVTPDAFQTIFVNFVEGGCRVFMSKLNPKSAGRASLVYSTYLGGGKPQIIEGIDLGADDEGYGLAVDSNGFVYLAGRTLDANFPVTPGAVQPVNRGIFSAFVTVLNPAAKGSAGLLYSTCLGSTSLDAANGVALGQQNGLVYITGFTGLPHSVPANLWPITANAFESELPAPVVTPSQRQSFGIAGAIAAILNPAIPTPSATPAATAKATATPRMTAHATPTRTPRATSTPKATPTQAARSGT